ALVLHRQLGPPAKRAGAQVLVESEVVKRDHQNPQLYGAALREGLTCSMVCLQAASREGLVCGSAASCFHCVRSWPIICSSCARWSPAVLSLTHAWYLSRKMSQTSIPTLSCASAGAPAAIMAVKRKTRTHFMCTTPLVDRRQRLSHRPH